jgi:hypothetical protein
LHTQGLISSMARTWEDYFATVKPSLGARAATFEKIFEHLDEFEDPLIIETGTYREENNYTGDGCSTLLFDNYIDIKKTGRLVSVDIDPAACELALSSTKHAEVYEADSVEFLETFGAFEDLAVLYLDSYNITDWRNDWAPAAHHLKELFCAKEFLRNNTLIVVDDNIKTPNGQRYGKGRLIYELMESIGIEPWFDQYQIGWIWL